MATATHAADGDLITTFNPSSNGEVNCIAVQPDGRIIVGGRFYAMAGLERENLARLYPDGTIDPTFAPNPDGEVRCVAVQADGRIVVGGDFDELAGVSRGKLARLNPDGTLDSAFNPGVSSTVKCLALQADGRILFGGSFSSVGEVTRQYLGRLNVNGTLDTAFNPAPSQDVNSITVQPDGRIVLGGAFGTVAGQSRRALARINANGTLDAAFNPISSGIDEIRHTALLADGSLLVSGEFIRFAGYNIRYLARVYANGTVDPTFTPNPGSTVYTTAMQADGRILIGGDFSMVGDLERSGIARINPNGTRDLTFNPPTAGPVNSAALLANGRILLGGGFWSTGPVTIENLAQLENGSASQTLSRPSAAQVQWLRGGTAPEVTQVSFDLSTDETTWSTLGAGTRITGGWQLNGLSLPARGILRARARTIGGKANGSSGLIEQEAAFNSTPTPEITVTGGGIRIPRGDTTPSVADYTDFGVAATSGYSVTRTFAIWNIGTAGLNLTGNPRVSVSGPQAASFTVTLLPSTPVPAGGTTPFQVTFRPTGTGLRTATLSIVNNDPSENPYTFAIQGTGVAIYNPVVTSVNDSGPGSLRQALVDASPGGTITFSPALAGQPISLTSGQLEIDKDVSLVGDTTSPTVLSGSTSNRVFLLNSGFSLTLDRLAITGGRADSGGGILNLGGWLRIKNCLFNDNRATNGGAIFTQRASADIQRSVFSGNSAERSGGAIFLNGGGALLVDNCTISGNAAAYGSALFNEGLAGLGRATIRRSSLVGNATTVGGAISGRGASTLTIGHTLLAHGTSGSNYFSDPSYTPGVIVNEGYNLSDDGSTSAFATQVASLRLGPLAYNGSQARTHALLSDSPALDAGSTGQPNAWQITDDSSTAGVAFFTNTLTSLQKQTATNNGWRFTVVSRLVNGSGGASPAQFMSYGHGNRRFIVGWDLDASGRLIARFYGAGGTFSGTTAAITAPYEGTNDYHLHELVYDPATITATYRVDGAAIFTWSGLAPNADYIGQAFFGAAAGTGRGQMNYHRVRFDIHTLGTVSDYFAGFAGSPAAAPSPTSQGWTLSWAPGPGTTVTNIPVSPDVLTLSPVTLGALGLDYDQRGPAYARIANGRMDIGAYEVQQPKATALSLTPSGLTMSVRGEPGEVLTVEWNSVMAATGWQPLTTASTDDSGMLTVWDPSPPSPRRFYRTVRK